VITLRFAFQHRSKSIHPPIDALAQIEPKHTPTVVRSGSALARFFETIAKNWYVTVGWGRRADSQKNFSIAVVSGKVGILVS
jgi:hypothetical protein